MRKNIGVLGLLAVLGTLAVLLAPVSGALTQKVVVHTEVEWGPQTCLEYWTASLADPTVPGSQVHCSPTGYAELNEVAYSGWIVGVDPEMGSNSWVSCKVWINGELEHVDFAEAGDGHEATCSSRVP